MNNTKRYLLSISLFFGILFNLGNPAIPLYTNSLNISGRFVGLYLASGGIGLLFFATLWGALGDLKDRKKVLGLVFIGFGVGQSLFGLFEDKYLLLVASLISGLFVAGALVNIYSYINDTCKQYKERSKVLSYSISLYMFGGAIAYVLGGYLTKYFSPNYNYTFFVQGALLFLFGVYIFLKKTNTVDFSEKLSRSHFWMDLKQIVKLPWVPIYTITITFFVSFSHNNITRFLDYYIIDNQISVLHLGYFVFTVGIIGLISNLVIAPFLLKRMHNFRLLQIQFLLAPVFLYLTFQTTNLFVGLYTFFIGYTIILSIYEPTAVSFISKNKAISQGILLGVRQSVVGLGMTVGFIVGGFIFEIKELYVFYLAAIFYIIVFVAFSVLIIIKKKEVREYRKEYLKEVNHHD